MPTLNKSTGVALATGVSAKVCRQIVFLGEATVITAGTTGYDTTQLNTPTLDTAFTAATLTNPILLGVDAIMFEPVQYPQAASFG
jgi:hypothetical protein